MCCAKHLRKSCAGERKVRRGEEAFVAIENTTVAETHRLSQSMALHLPPEGCPINPQNLGGLGAVSSCKVEDMTNIVLLQFFEA